MPREYAAAIKKVALLERQSPDSAQISRVLVQMAAKALQKQRGFIGIFPSVIKWFRDRVTNLKMSC
jgi:hypothetical protein